MLTGSSCASTPAGHPLAQDSACEVSPLPQISCNPTGYPVRTGPVMSEPARMTFLLLNALLILQTKLLLPRDNSLIKWLRLIVRSGYCARDLHMRTSTLRTHA